MLDGMQMFIEDVNGRGGASGRTVELVVYDDQSDPAVTARLYEKLIVEDQVDLLVGPYSTPQTIAAAEVAEKHNFPLVVTASGSGLFNRGLRNVFGLYTPASEIMRPVLELARQNGLSSVAIAYANDDAPTSMAEGVRAEVAEYDLQLVLDESYDRNSVRPEQLAATISRMAATDPDVAIFGAYLEDSVALLQASKAQNFSPEIMIFSFGPALYDFGAAVGLENANGVMSTSQWLRGERMPGAYDFAFRFKQRTGRDPGYPAAGAYATGQVAEAAARLAGRGASLDAYREQLRNMSFRSLLGPYRVDDTGKQIGKPIYILQWQDGERHLIFPAEFAHHAVIYPFPAWVSR